MTDLPKETGSEAAMPQATRGSVKAIRISELRCWGTVAVGCAVLTIPSTIEAQTVLGIVVDSNTDAGLARVSVEVLRDEEVIARSESDALGSFVIYLNGGGTYRLRASRLGLLTANLGPMEVGARELVEVRIPMSDTPILLDEIEVQVRRRDSRVDPTYEGFYARRELAHRVGSNRVVTRADPEMASSMTVRDVLRWFLPPRGCMDYYVDGYPVRRNYWEEVVMSLSPELLEGIEFYRNDWERPIGFDTPNRPFLQSGATCSVVAVWRRRPGM